MNDLVLGGLHPKHKCSLFSQPCQKLYKYVIIILIGEYSKDRWMNVKKTEESHSAFSNLFRGRQPDAWGVLYEMPLNT